MKKFIPLVVSLVLLLTLAVPMASAASVSGTGQNRTITFSDPYQNTNMTVVVPTILNNETANSFAFVVIDESSTSVNYTFNVSVNGTWNGTVDIVSVADDNVTGYVNYTIYTFDVVKDANITIWMSFTDNWTQADAWWGTVDIVDNANFGLRVTTVQLLVSLLGIAVVIAVFAALIRSIKVVKPKGGKK